MTGGNPIICLGIMVADVANVRLTLDDVDFGMIESASMPPDIDTDHASGFTFHASEACPFKGTS